jgi:hypothetical protein
MALKWSNSADLTRATVAPGATRRLDFLRAENGGAPQGQLPLIVEVRPEPANDRHHLAPAEVRFEVLLTASNADATQYTIMVTWDGRFPQDPSVLWTHLKIAPPQRM